jgi:hypothetical protein
VDSESAGRSHRDFFSEHPDDVAARERELVVDVSEVQADVLAPGQSSVPIFNISGGQEDYQGQQEMSNPEGIDSGRISAGKQGFVVPRSQGERTGGEMEVMRVGDLNLTADNASTITGSMNTLFIRHAGGEKTRADRLPDQEPHNGGELLQTVQLEARVNARYPADNEDHGGGKASRLKPSTPSGPHPETSGRLKNRGVMDMVWESDDESEVDDSVSEEEDSLERLEDRIKEEVGLVVQLEG